MSRKKSRNKRKQSIDNNINLIIENNLAIIEGAQQKKKWTIHDLNVIKPITPRQEDAFHAWFNDKNLCLFGTAGTGKTFIAIYLALNEILNANQSKIILVRSVVPTREIGHLPGDLEEKIVTYELPYHDIFKELLNRKNSYIDLKAANVVEFTTTSFIRGLTWDNSIVIVDEAENMNYHEINSIMTRLGKNSRIIFAGDIKQTDLNKKHDKSGFDKAISAFNEMKSFEIVEFNPYDIVRSELVKEWILANERI